MATQPPSTDKSRYPELLLQNWRCFSLYAASNVARHYLLDPLGLTYMQYICMMVMWGGEAGYDILDR
ncbi:hypothetical protein [Atopobium sp. oral taxon 416]|uniref:hypothetical protein n=1 Tax=Atopobium sp. oral taxon 416 TaxID=712157 RepID=UPI001BA8F872|nr:hypothetical protein [Atopobium sp. oral taxon 416]QUC04395.1 hypothetical protein J4859_05545 [Atopobium sp. oral taxon 416]